MQEKTSDILRSRDSDALGAAFAREGCPVCLVTLDYLERAMDNWEYEGFTDEEHRHQLIRSRGFCPLHTWQLAQRHNAFRLGVIYSEILADVLEELDAKDGTPAPAETGAPKRESARKHWWRGARHRTDVRPKFEDCPFCIQRAKIEERLISTLVQLLDAEQWQAGLCQSTGLCLTHFTQACQIAERHPPVIMAHLQTCQRTCTQRVLEEVRELVRKHDYRFGGEVRGEEMVSWRRAAELCAGNPGVF
jgi:hypothetical protein